MSTEGGVSCEDCGDSLPRWTSPVLAGGRRQHQDPTSLSQLPRGFSCANRSLQGLRITEAFLPINKGYVSSQWKELSWVEKNLLCRKK